MAAFDSTREELRKAMLALRASPSFPDFIKTLSRRREAVVTSWASGSGESEALRGEVRAYDYLIKAATTTE
jgi:hypothetical protein